MGFFLGTTLPDGTLVGERLGVYGAERAMMALWFGAYAVAGRPESVRVAGWVRPCYRRPKGLSGPAEEIIPYTQWYRPSGVRKILAVNDEDQCWIELERHGETLKRGVKMKPPADPWLEALVRFYWFTCERPPSAEGILSEREADSLNPVLQGLLPYLEVSCWHRKLKVVADAVSEAARHGVTLHCG
jgi:hypothetical protein